MIVAVAIVSWCAAVEVVLSASRIAAHLETATSQATRVPRPQQTIVFDRHGRQAFSFFVEQRIDVPLDQVSPHMIDAIVSVEDRRFFSHHGVDPVRIAAALWRNVRAGRIREGGSTITQQLARATQLSPVRTYERKIREALIAIRLEQRYSKSQILEEYLNTVYFGDGYYGVEAASRGYFGKAAADLAPQEAALLAALVRSPSTDAPSVSTTRALRRRNLVLRLMRNQGRLNEIEYQQAAATPVRASAAASTALLTASSDTGLYFQEEIRRQLVARFGSDAVMRGGLRVYSTYDPDMQRQAEETVTTRIAEIVKTRPRAKDLQASLVAMDPGTGDVYALVGGRDFRASSFNRATQARRQAGSAFKPIIYAAAVERGLAPGTLIRDLDAPVEAAEGDWLPSGDHEAAEYTLRRALQVSSNRAAVQVLQRVGLTTAVYYAHRLGILSDLPLVPSLALGTGDVTLLELTGAYTAFANRGVVSTPRLITRVEDNSGTTIYECSERHTQAISPTTAYLMSSMLADVVNSGTGARVRGAGFKLPAGGKTGTTDDYADAWFVGYTPHLVAGIWFGLDRPAPIMRGGFAGVVAAPAWGRFMKQATTGAKADWYDTPSDVEKVAICRLSGARATEACRHQNDAAFVPAVYSESGAVQDAEPEAPAPPPVYEDLFPAGAVPQEACPLHNAVATAATDSATPTVDALLHQASAVTPTGTSGYSAVRINPARVVVERVMGADGVVHTVYRQQR